VSDTFSKKTSKVLLATPIWGASAGLHPRGVDETPENNKADIDRGQDLSGLEAAEPLSDGLINGSPFPRALHG